jgi:hypothetical protein
VATSSYNDAVELHGADLDHARQLIAQAHERMAEARRYLAELGTVVMTALGQDGRAVAVELAPMADTQDEGGGHSIACYYAQDGTCLACWEDPPGVCRPCSDSKPGPMSPAPVMLMLE